MYNVTLHHLLKQMPWKATNQKYCPTFSIGLQNLLLKETYSTVPVGNYLYDALSIQNSLKPSDNLPQKVQKILMKLHTTHQL